MGPEGRGPAGIVEPGLDVDESRSRPVGSVGEVPPEGPVGGCWRVRDWVGPAQEGSGGRYCRVGTRRAVQKRVPSEGPDRLWCCRIASRWVQRAMQEVLQGRNQGALQERIVPEAGW